MITEALHKQNKFLLWGILIAFVALNTLMLAMEIYYVPLIPAVLLFVALAIVSVDKYLLLIVFFAPISVPLSALMEGLSIDMYLPTEPLLAGLLLLYGIKYLMGDRIDIRILRHPVTLAIYFHLAWLFVTSITSSDPLVSFKYLLSRLWFIVGFYLLATQIFKREKGMRTYLWLFIIAFTGIILYTLVNHAQYGLTNQVMAHSVSKPFYNDHTSYGAVLAFLLPVLVALFTTIRRDDINIRFLMVLLILLFVGGINTFLSLYYYLRVVKVMTIDSEPEPVGELRLPPAAVAYTVLITVPTALLLLSWDSINELTLAAAQFLLISQ